MIHTLVSAETLAAHLDDPDWVVFDCRHALADLSAGVSAYHADHIPGAFFADTECDLSGPKSGSNGRHPMPDPQAFASFLAAHGVSDRTQIVAYDAGADIFAARLWFLARYIGHDATAVLDGGLRIWSDEHRPMTASASAARAPGNLQVTLHPELVVDADFVSRHLGGTDMCIVDARGAERFAGKNETVDPVAGHIPTARNRPFSENYAADSRLKTADELRRRFEPLGPAGSIIHQCGSGISAAANMLAMEVAGLRGSRVYAGSWSEWIADPRRPVATGVR